MNKRVCCFLLIVVIPMFLLGCGGSNGGGDNSSSLGQISIDVAEEAKLAIENGVAWLLDQQNPDGSWGNREKVAVTAFAVKKLEHHAIDRIYGLGLDSPFDAPYADQLQDGLNFLFSNAFLITIGVQPAGDPDSDGDGIGVSFGLPMSRRTYNTGIVLMAIAGTMTPDRVVDVPGSPVHGWTYLEVVQDTVDYLCFGQNDSGWPRGGWGYYENFVEHSDNSNTGYVVHGLLCAEAAPPEGFGLTVPQFLKDELEVWIDHIQCENPGRNFGGSGYVDACLWVNILKTGNLLKELALVGVEETDQRVQDALGYLYLHWDDQNDDPGWRGSRGGVASYQAMFTTMKGLTSLGIYEFGDPPIDWRADFVAVLLDQQNPDGSWPPTLWEWDPPMLSTLWALLTLQKVAPLPIIEGGIATVVFEDLPIGEENDYDYNDFITDVSVVGTYSRGDLAQLEFTFEAQARGARYVHDFHLLIPASTFGSDGTYTIELYETDGTLLSSTPGSFTGNTDLDLVIFDDTRDALPPNPGQSLKGNAIDGSGVQPGRVVKLFIDFDTPFAFDFGDYSPEGVGIHGENLFFDPYLYVRDTGEDIHITDPRLVVVPTDWEWPEDHAAIWTVYPYNSTSGEGVIAGSPPSFTTFWYTETPTDKKWTP